MKNERLKQEILNELPYFTGSEQLWEHSTPFGRLLLTDGCNFIREKAQCRWLFDLIQSHQPKLQGEEFQCWTLSRTKGNSFVTICDNGDGLELLRQDIPFSDMVLDELKIWLIEGTCLLPSEY